MTFIREIRFLLAIIIVRFSNNCEPGAVFPGSLIFYSIDFFLFEIRCWRARTRCNYRRMVGWSKRRFQGERYIVADIETFICMPYANCLVSSLVSTDVRVFLSRPGDDIDVELRTRRIRIIFHF